MYTGESQPLPLLVNSLKQQQQHDHTEDTEGKTQPSWLERNPLLMHYQNNAVEQEFAVYYFPIAHRPFSTALSSCLLVSFI